MQFHLALEEIEQTGGYLRRKAWPTTSRIHIRENEFWWCDEETGHVQPWSPSLVEIRSDDWETHEFSPGPGQILYESYWSLEGRMAQSISEITPWSRLPTPTQDEWNRIAQEFWIREKNRREHDTEKGISARSSRLMKWEQYREGVIEVQTRTIERHDAITRILAGITNNDLQRDDVNQALGYAWQCLERAVEETDMATEYLLAIANIDIADAEKKKESRNG